MKQDSLYRIGVATLVAAFAISSYAGLSDFQVETEALNAAAYTSTVSTTEPAAKSAAYTYNPTTQTYTPYAVKSNEYIVTKVSGAGANKQYAVPLDTLKGGKRLDLSVLPAVSPKSGSYAPITENGKTVYAPLAEGQTVVSVGGTAQTGNKTYFVISGWNSVWTELIVRVVEIGNLAKKCADCLDEWRDYQLAQAEQKARDAIVNIYNERILQAAAAGRDTAGLQKKLDQASKDAEEAAKQTADAKAAYEDCMNKGGVMSESDRKMCEEHFKNAPLPMVW